MTTAVTSWTLDDLSPGDRMRLCPHDGMRVLDEIKELVGCDDCGIWGYSARPLLGPDERRCSSCREVKPLDQFRTDNSRPRGRGYYCHPCRRTLSKEWRQRRKEASDA